MFFRRAYKNYLQKQLIITNFETFLKMKKQNFIMVFALVAFGFMACNNKAENELQKTISEDEAVQFMRMMTVQERLDMDKKLGRTTNYVFVLDNGESPYITTRSGNGTFGVTIQHDGWGRLSRGTETNRCGGAGLCDARVVRRGYTIVGDGGFGSILELNPITGQFYIDVLLAEPVPNNITRESFNLHMDDYLFVNSVDILGIDLALQEGVFSLNPDLGVAGGYRIPLVVVE